MSRLLLVTHNAALPFALASTGQEIIQLDIDEDVRWAEATAGADVVVLDVEDPAAAQLLIDGIAHDTEGSRVVLLANGDARWDAIASAPVPGVRVLPRPLTMPRLLATIDEILAGPPLTTPDGPTVASEQTIEPSVLQPAPAVSPDPVEAPDPVEELDPVGQLDQPTSAPALATPLQLPLEPERPMPSLPGQPSGPTDWGASVGPAVTPARAWTVRQKDGAAEPPQDQSTPQSDPEPGYVAEAKPVAADPQGQDAPAVELPATSVSDEPAEPVTAQHHHEAPWSPPVVDVEARLASVAHLTMAPISHPPISHPPISHPPAPDDRPPSAQPPVVQALSEPSAPQTQSLVRSLTASANDLASVAETAQIVLGAAIAVTGATAGALMVRDGPEWRVAAGEGLRALEERLRLVAGHWLVKEVSASRHGLLLQGRDGPRQQLYGAPLANREHLMAAPLPPVGAIVLLAREGVPFTKEDLVALMPVTKEAAPLLVDALDVRRLARLIERFADHPD